jgi:hypothetical protein
MGGGGKLTVKAAEVRKNINKIKNKLENFELRVEEKILGKNIYIYR